MFGFFMLLQTVPPPVQEEVTSVFQQLVSFVAANGLLSVGGVLMIAAYALTLIATITPNDSDNKIADLLWKLVNFIGGNFGKSKNQ